MSKKSSSAQKKGREKEMAVTVPATLGKKRQCPSCRTKFYDFNKAEIHCPKCDAVIDPTAVVRRVEPKRSVQARPIDSLDDEGDVVVVEDSGGLDSDDMDDTDVGAEVTVADDDE